MIALIFILFVMYTLACIADGPDVKPRWKSWLGNKFLRLSQRYIRVYPCFGPPVCSHIRDVRESEERYRTMYALLRNQVDRIAATNTGGETLIRSCVEITESRIAEMYFRSQHFGGISFERQKDEAIFYAKELCKNNIIDSVSKGIAFDVREDPRTKSIFVTGNLVANRMYNGIDV